MPKRGEESHVERVGHTDRSRRQWRQEPAFGGRHFAQLVRCSFGESTAGRLAFDGRRCVQIHDAPDALAFTIGDARGDGSTEAVPDQDHVYQRFVAQHRRDVRDVQLEGHAARQQVKALTTPGQSGCMDLVPGGSKQAGNAAPTPPAFECSVDQHERRHVCDEANRSLVLHHQRSDNNQLNAQTSDIRGFFLRRGEFSFTSTSNHDRAFANGWNSRPRL